MAEVADLWVKLSLVSTGFSEGLAKSGAEAEGFSAKVSKVGSALAGMAKAGAAAGIGIAAISVKMAGDWQASMSKLVTSAGETGNIVDGKLTGPISKVSDGLLKMAVSTGTSTKALADGMYFVESAGFHGADALKVMQAAAEGARAEGANLSTVTDALTTALHDMGMGATGSVPMMNMMVKAVGDGKMTMEQFAGSLHSVLPQAHQMGIAFPDVAAAIATMTVAGTTADNATMMLGHTIGTLQKPSALAVKWMGQMGLSSTDLSSNLGNRGLLGTITMIDQAILQHMGKDGLALQSAFNQSKSAGADLNTMLGAMPGKLRDWSTAVEQGKMTATDYTAAIKGLPANLQAQGQEFMTAYKSATSFNTALRGTTPDVLTFGGMLAKVLGDQVSANTALQIGGTNLAYYAKTAQDVAAAGQNAGDHIETWSTIQQGFNFRMDQAKESVQTTAIRVGTMLLPKMMSLFDLLTTRGGPILHQLERDVRNALDSTAVHQAEAVITQFWRDFISFMGDATRSTENLWRAVEPLASQLATGLFGGLKLVGDVLKNVVGPSLLMVTGFFRDHATEIRYVADVALAALIAKLLYTKTLLAFDMFASFAKGISNAIIGLANFGKAVASGQIFDTIRLKAMYAGDAVKGIGTAATEAGDKAAVAAGTSGFGQLLGNVGSLAVGGLVVGGAIAGLSLLTSWIGKAGTTSRDASLSVNQFTTAAANASHGAAIGVPDMQRIVDVMRDLHGEVKKIDELPDLPANKIFGTHMTSEIQDTLSKLRTEIPQTTDAFAAYGVTVGKINQVTGDAGSELKNFDTTLAQLATSGHADYVAQEMQKIASVVDSQHTAVINTARDFPQYTKAVADAKSKLDDAKIPLDASVTSLNNQATSADNTTTSLDGLSQQLGGTATATDGLANATDALMQQQQDMSKGLNADRALDDYNRAVNNLNKSLNDNGNSFKGTTDAAMNNRDALRGAVQTIIDNYNAQVSLTGDTDAATKKLHEQVNELENQKGMSKETKDAIKAYVDQLNLIPTTVTTTVTANTTVASQHIQSLQDKLNYLAMSDSNKPSPSSTTPTSTPPPPPKHRQYALGGWVDGPKGAPQLAIVHGGEYVLSNDMLDSAGGGGSGGGPPSAGGTTIIIHNHIQGSVIAEQDVRNLVETQMLQTGGRRPKTYAPYRR